MATILTDILIVPSFTMLPMVATIVVLLSSRRIISSACRGAITDCSHLKSMSSGLPRNKIRQNPTSGSRVETYCSTERDMFVNTCVLFLHFVRIQRVHNMGTQRNIASSTWNIPHEQPNDIGYTEINLSRVLYSGTSLISWN